MLTASVIKDLISGLEGVVLIDGFSTNEDGSLWGRIEVEVSQGNEGLKWDVVISPYYPFKSMGVASIQFRNIHLLEYPHIMKDGSLCMHPKKHKDSKSQFICDLEFLKDWVKIYYLHGKKDAHYEHLIVNPHLVENEYYTFCFAETHESFPVGDFGLVYYTSLQKGWQVGNVINNFVVQKFASKKYHKKEFACKISSIYQILNPNLGVYCLLKDPPATHGKFIIEDYDHIRGLFSQEQKNYIYSFVLLLHKKSKSVFPLFCGYKIPSGEIHWQAMVIFMDDLPIEAVRVGTGKERAWYTEFKSGKIQWARTENISYEYFFGRGAMPKELANKRVLILGIGAVGSIVAETLTRCGAKYLTLYDVDQKEPGNVCRSAYSFFAGITEKMQELRNALNQISPHIECTCLNQGLDYRLKTSSKEHRLEELSNFLDEYDIVLDCTTDNQLMWILDDIESKAQLINLSITNHAQELVCAFSPNVTDTIETIFSLLSRDIDTDMYNPTGCWSPTFKASYNDVSSKVQFAVKHIVKMLTKTEPQSNFYITENDSILSVYKL